MARLFLFLDGDEQASFTASVVPRVGEAVWLKTLEYEGTVLVESVEYQFDRSKAETYGNDDVCLYCKRK